MPEIGAEIAPLVPDNDRTGEISRPAFELLRERFRHRMCFVVARQEGEVVAGTVNVQKGSLYGRYWGAFRQLRHLHFNVCYYAGVEHCIENGLARFEPGAGGRRHVPERIMRAACP